MQKKVYIDYDEIDVDLYRQILLIIAQKYEIVGCMKKNMRKIVETGYDRGDYLAAFPPKTRLKRLQKRFFKKLIKSIPKNAKILDLGCGPGVPYDKYLVEKHFEVIGVDISKKHIDMAKKNVPQAKFIKGDFSRVQLPNRSFDALISLYAIFHIPRTEHKRLFLKMNKMLKKNGKILVTVGCSDHAYQEASNWAGAKMAWSTYDSEKNKRLIKDAGFGIIKSEFEGKSGDKEHHLWILARKK